MKIDKLHRKLINAQEDLMLLKEKNDQLENSVKRLTSVNAMLRAELMHTPATPNTSSAVNSQKSGDHYKEMGDYQPWQVAAAWMNPQELKGFMKGTVIAYLEREEDKGGELDIEKAHHTLGLYLELRDKK